MPVLSDLTRGVTKVGAGTFLDVAPVGEGELGTDRDTLTSS